MRDQKPEKDDQCCSTGFDGAVRVRLDLTRALAGETVCLGADDQIAESWRRATVLGLTPDEFDPPLFQRVEADARFLQAAMPVVDRLGSDLASTQISVILAAERCRVVARRASGPLEEAQLELLKFSPGYLWGIEDVGTNGLGAALLRGIPTLVQGNEHFADVLTTMATAGAPIRDPRTAQVVGVLALVCSAEVANRLLLPMVTRVAREIEQGLLCDSSGLERLVHANFLDARRRTRSPLAAITRSTLLTNAAAARHLRDADRLPLWEFVSKNLRVHGTVKTRFTAADGNSINLSLEAIHEGQEVAGALVRFATPGVDVPSRQSPPSRTLHPAFGWESLTAAEHSVLELVAEGLTNREVAIRLFLSAHTVDSHLRHIFRKLDINSRVDVVRIVAGRSVVQPLLSAAADVA